MAIVVRIIIIAIKWFFSMNIIWKTLIKIIAVVIEWHNKFIAVIMEVVKWVMVIVNAFLAMIAVLKALGDKILDFFRMIKSIIDELIGGGFDIPGLAEGGAVFSPTIARLAENEPEMIIPFSKMGGFGNEGNEDLLYAMEENTATQMQILAVAERKARWER